MSAPQSSSPGRLSAMQGPLSRSTPLACTCSNSAWASFTAWSASSLDPPSSPPPQPPTRRTATPALRASFREVLSVAPAPHLGGAAAGEAGTRTRARLGTLARRPLLLLGGSLGLLRLFVVGREDLLLRLALEQGDELLGLDRLALEQDLRDRVELLAMVGEDVLRGLVGLFDDAPDLVVDLAGDLVGVVGLG